MNQSIASEYAEMTAQQYMRQNGEDCQVQCPIPCKTPNPCDDPCKKGLSFNMGNGWGWLAALILWFIVFTVLFWLIFYSLKPSFVLQPDTNQVDTAKVLLAAVIAALLLVIIIWLIKAVVVRP